MESTQKLKTKRIVIALICLALFLAAFFTVLSLYQNDGTQRSADWVFGDDKKTDRMNVNILVREIDPIKGDLVARVTPDSDGKYSDNSSLPAKELKFYHSAENGKSTITVEKGRVPDSLNSTFALFGKVSDYPFDRHTADIYTYFVNPKDETESIPIVVNFFGKIPGMNIDADYIPEKEFKSEDDYIGIRVTTSRSIVTKLFSVFIMIAMWIVGLAVLLMALAVLLVPRPVELGMFIYMGSLLFALPAVRGLQPGVPPIGALTDFLSFFWVETIVTVSLLIIFYCWLTRFEKKT